MTQIVRIAPRRLKPFGFGSVILFEPPPFAMPSRNLARVPLQATEGIKQRAMRRGISERAIIMLAVWISTSAAPTRAGPGC